MARQRIYSRDVLSIFVGCLVAYQYWKLLQYMNDSDSFSSKDEKYVQGTTTKNVAISFRTRYPFSTKFFKKIYGISQMLNSTSKSNSTSFKSYFKYDLIVMVDTTTVTKTVKLNSSSSSSPQADLRKFYDSQQSQQVRIVVPEIFEVNEDMVLKEYPRLSNYLYNNNTEELNYNNQPGFKEGNSLMWQLLVPTAALMYKHISENQNHNNHYEYIWYIEDDIDAIGAMTLLETIQKWDISMLFLQQHPHEVDLAAISLLGIGKVQKGSSKHLHTNSFHSILDRMNEVVDRKRQRERNNNSKSYFPVFDHKTPWTSFSDSVHRYSHRLAIHLHEQISRNIFAWCETFVHPIAWNGDYTVVDLRSFAVTTTTEEVEGRNNIVEVFRIDQHSNRKEVLQYYNASERIDMNMKIRRTIIFHGESLDRAH